MYDILFHDKAKRQLERLSSEVQKRILNSLERIKIRPYSYVKRLANSKYYRLRIGHYRVILDIISNQLLIIVIEVGHGKKIYKK